MSVLIYVLGCVRVCLFYPYAASITPPVFYRNIPTEWKCTAEREHPWERDHSAGWQ